VTESGIVVQAPVDRRWRAVRMVLVGVWVLLAAMSWWSAPRETSPSQVRSELAAGDVVAYEWGDSWDTDSGWSWGTSPDLRTSENGPILAWRTADWRVHYTTLDGASPTSPAAVALKAAINDAVPGDARGDFRARPLFATIVAVLFGLTVLALLIGGPAPVTGTRWFWFWVMTGVPLGLGFLYWLAAERPWSPRATPREGRPGRDNRRRWYFGIGVSIVASFGCAVLVYGLNELLGEMIVPSVGL
jgi:hypothetical protein